MISTGDTAFADGPAISRLRYAVLTLAVPAERAFLSPGPTSIPGVTVSEARSLLYPENARTAVHRVLAQAGLTRWMESWVGGDAPRVVPWETIYAFVRDRLTPLARDHIESCAFQQSGVSWACSSAGTLASWPTSSGKTLLGIISALASPGVTLFVCKKAAREHIRRQIQQYTRDARIDTLTGESPRPIKKDAQWLITGWHTLPAWVPSIIKIKPKMVIWDELHLGKNPRRWEASSVSEEFSAQVQRGDKTLERGSRIVTARDGSGFLLLRDRNNIVSAASHLSYRVPRRLGLTATVAPDRVRDQWGEFTLLHPGQGNWGSYRDFSRRYCNGRQTKWGWKAEGESFEQELSLRRLTFQHVVSQAEAWQSFPPLRRSVVILTEEDLNEPSSGFVLEFKRAEKAARARGTHDDSDPVLEAKLAYAASLKRKWVLGHADDVVASKQKLCIFVRRLRELEIWTNALRRRFKAKNVHIFTGRGGDNVQAVADTYYAAERPAILVAMAQAFGESIEGLHDTDVGIIAQLPYNEAQWLQTEGRLRRRGSTHSVIILYPVARGTYDDRVCEILLEKLPAAERASGSSEGGHADFVGQLEGLGDRKAVADASADLFNKLWSHKEGT